MDTQKIIVECTGDGLKTFAVILNILLPIFLAYLASAAYAFQRRRADIAAVYEAIKDMQLLTIFAIDRTTGFDVNLQEVKKVSFNLISRVRLEMLHRPEYIQNDIKIVLENFLLNADIAKGELEGDVQQVIERMNNAENNLIHMARQMTILEAIKQAWSNHGISDEFNSLLSKYRNN